MHSASDDDAVRTTLIPVFPSHSSNELYATPKPVILSEPRLSKAKVRRPEGSMHFAADTNLPLPFDLPSPTCYKCPFCVSRPFRLGYALA